MKLGATVSILQSDPGTFARRLRQLEDAGIDHFWCGEAYTSDAVSTLGFVAAVTTRATIGSSILPLYTRTPSLLAMTAVGLDKVSGGRFILGLGSSGPQVVEGFHGVGFDHPVRRTRETIEICRSVWRRDRLVYDGESYRIPLGPGQGTGLGKALRLADRPVRDRIPIYVASLGPANVEMTAEIAEGWLPLHFWPERVADVFGPSLGAGLGRRAADLPPLQVVAGGPLAIGSDLEQLRESIRPALALYFGGMGARGKNFYNDLLVRYGYEKEAADIQNAFLGGDRDAAAAMVPSALVDAVSLVGDQGFVKDRISSYRDAGVTILNVQAVGPNGVRDIETVADWIA